MLLWLTACALVTKQADFDVDLAIFDDEAGTAEAPADIPLELKLYDSRTEWVLPTFLDVEDWGAMLLADSALRADGGDGFLAVDVSTLSLDADPGFVELTVVLSSRDDRRYMVDSPEAVRAPGPCTFPISDGSAPEDLEEGLLACLHAWADTNGAPPDPEVTISVTDTDLDKFALAADLSFGVARPTEVLCSGRLGVSDEMREEADNIALEALDLAGYVAGVRGPMDLVAFQNTYPEETGDPVAGGATVVQLDAIGGTYIGQETAIDDILPAGVSIRGVAPISYFPDRDGWQSNSIAALETDAGYIEACWVAIHEDETGEALVRFKLVGDGHYDGREN